MKLHVANLVAGPGSKVSGARGGGLAPNKTDLRGGWMPLQLNHQSWSKAETTEHEEKCCCLLHPNLAPLKIDSHKSGPDTTTSLCHVWELLHSFRPELELKKPCGLHVSDEGIRSKTSHVPQTRPSNAVEQNRGPTGVQHLDPLLRSWDL